MRYRRDLMSTTRMSERGQGWGGLRRTWRNGVDGDTFRAELFGKDARQLFNRAFRRGINEVRRYNRRIFGKRSGEENDSPPYQ